MMAFWEKLLSSDFMPHGACYLWRSDVLWVHVVADAIIGLSYYSIPLTLIYFVRRRRDFGFRKTLYLFGAFILACGTTHLFAIFTLWRPYYPLEGAIKMATAGFSLVSAIVLVRVIPEALAAPDPVSLKWINTALEGELAQRTKAGQYFQSILESAPDPIVIVRASGVIELANSRSEGMFGYEAGEMVGMEIGNLVAPGDRERCLSHLQHFLGDPSSTVSGAGFELTGVHRSGLAFPIEITLSALRLEEGSFVTAAMRDITERKRFEAQIREVNAELDQRVRDRTAELEKSLHDREALLREVHHRVKNNLQIVSGLLSMQADQVTGDNAIETFREGQSRVQAIAFLHEALYDSGVQERVAIGDYLPRLVSNLAGMYSTGRIPFAPTIQLEHESVGLKEAVPLGLILNELVSNAMKHAYPEGMGGPIDVEVVSMGNGWSCLAVSDCGAGTPESLSAGRPGSLGIRMVESLVRQLGGRFRIERNGERGVRCIVEFPTHPGESV